MKKKILSVVLAAVLVGVVVPVLPAVSASAANYGIWFNPQNPDPSGDVKEGTIVYAEANANSAVVAQISGPVYDDGRVIDSQGNEWVKVKLSYDSDAIGYVKVSDYGVRYY